MRRVLGGAKVGHAGTLDPDATGVLVLCIGKATKISAFLMEGEKEYAGTGRLGVTTDTQDATGTTLEERPVCVTAEEVRRAAAEMTGEIVQVPPMYSAVKVDGQRLYRLARKGVKVERAGRKVTVHSLEVVRVELPEFDFALRCSKGTYVRTIVHDLGERLGCGGHLRGLVRRRQGTFRLEEALSWEALAAPDAAQAIRSAVVAPEEALGFLPSWTLPPAALPRRVGEVVSGGPEGVASGALVHLAAPSGTGGGVGRVGEAGVRILHLFPSSTRYGRGRRVS